LSYRDAKSL